MILCIGIDPSLTSTGICVRKVDPDEGWRETCSPKFYIVHGPKYSKKENKAAKDYAGFFEYVTCELISDKEIKESSSSLFEMKKTMRLIEIARQVREIVSRHANDGFPSVSICIEGISYGSVHGTKSIFDLAGLNYLIRKELISYNKNWRLTVAPPSVIKKFATGKGNANKEAMIDLFNTIYPDFDLPKKDDVVDAFFMSRYAQKESEATY